MCELISWIEKEEDGENKLFYITDTAADILVNEHDMFWDDTVGHHAIQMFWKIKAPFKKFQFPVLADIYKMPDEILKALESGKFNKMMKQTFQHLKHVGNNCFIHKRWYSNKQLAYENNYRDGELHGISRGWYPNGNPESEYNYRNGEKHGVCKDWYIGETLMCERYYKDGVRQGRPKTANDFRKDK